MHYHGMHMSRVVTIAVGYCTNDMTVVDKGMTVIIMLVLSSCIICNRLCSFRVRL